MIKFLDDLPYESVIAIAVMDSSSTNFDEADVGFMETLGAGGNNCPINLRKIRKR